MEKKDPVDLTYRKSRYDKVKLDLEKKYKDGIVEVDTREVPKTPSQFNYIDLFAGAGGLSLGIKQAGFNKLCDVEILNFAVDTLRRNFPEAYHYNGDIKDFKPLDITNQPIHLVVGGPPCQGFSVAGKRNKEDLRNQLFKQYHRVVQETQPYFFVLENVPGILTLDQGKFYKRIVKGFEELGYTVSVRILEAADYGVPQLRTRAIFIGNRLGLKNPYPMRQYTPETYVSIDSAIADLENAPRCHETNHEWTRPSAAMEQRIAAVPPGGSLYDTFADAYKRQRAGQPSMTIKENHGGTHIHYKLNRCISAREMARLQSFPDDFIFEGTFKQAFIQVGNAVPPLLAKNIGLAIRQTLEGNEKTIADVDSGVTISDTICEKISDKLNSINRDSVIDENPDETAENGSYILTVEREGKFEPVVTLSDSTEDKKAQYKIVCGKDIPEIEENKATLIAMLETQKYKTKYFLVNQNKLNLLNAHMEQLVCQVKKEVDSAIEEYKQTNPKVFENHSIEMISEKCLQRALYRVFIGDSLSKGGIIL